MIEPSPSMGIPQPPIDAVVEAHGLTKIYRLYRSPWDRLFERLLRSQRHREQVAVRDVSFQVARGEGLGLVGQNGAGKSTLLKMLAGVLEPTSGSLRVAGTVSSILELGAGFHPEFTGRQNIRINAALLGLDAETVLQRTPDIERFCELDHYLDQPVKHYSTGMVMRLAFSIATQVDPEVLIVDEALSVGDGYFQKKCADRIYELLGQGTTLLFCSHAMYYVDAFCRQAIWLRDGRVAAQGSAPQVIAEYERYLEHKGAITLAAPAKEGGARSGPARLVELRVGEDGARPLLRHGQPLRIEVAWECEDESLAFHVGVGVNRMDEVEVLTLSTRDLGLPAFTGARRYRGAFEIPDQPLQKGEFVLYAFLLDERQLHVYDRRLLRPAFGIETGPYEFALLRVPYRWVPSTPEPSEHSEERQGSVSPETAASLRE